MTVKDYEHVVAGAGFSVVSRDLGDYFYSIQQKELDAFLPTREAFVQEYSQQEMEEMVAVATNKASNSDCEDRWVLYAL